MVNSMTVKLINNTNTKVLYIYILITKNVTITRKWLVVVKASQLYNECVRAMITS